MSERQLPDGWRRVQVSAICKKIDYGFTASADFSVSNPRFLRITDIQDGYVDWNSVPGCQIGPDEETKNKLSDGDIVFARTGGTTGKSYLIKNPPRAVFASYLIRLQANQGQVIPEFLYAFFQSDSYWQQIRANARGGAQPNVNAQLLGTVRLPLAPLPEQRRIAAIIEERMAAVEQARASAQAQLDAAKGLMAAYLRDVFESEDAQGWERVRLGEAAVLERGRFSPRPRNDPRYYGGKYPWIQIGEVEAANKFITTHRNTLNELGLSVSKLFPKGTLVISIAATIGAVGILTFDSCMPDSLVGITPRRGLSNTEYLYYLLLFVRDHLESIAPQVAQANLKLAMLNPLEIPLPALDDQIEIVAMLNEQTSRLNTMRAALQRQLELINELPAAILRQAFNGEL